MLDFFIILSALVLGWGYVIGTLLYHTNLSRFRRTLNMDTERLVEGEAEANQFNDRKS